MGLDNTQKVPMPEHGIAKKKVSGKTYVYYTTATYRNAEGKPTNERSSIGRYDEESGMLIPNRNYYEIYLKKDVPVNKAIFDYGVYHAFNGISKKLGITELLERYFPENHKEILTVAQYMLSEGNVMYYIEDYTETHITALHGTMDDKRCSRVFSSLREEDILLFMREWLGHRKEDEYVAYDVTSISSYGKNIPELEWGYNRDREKLPQINMGMYYGEESRLPLYYRVYQGSISDKAHLKSMVSDNDFMGVRKMKYVMDRGFYSAENLQYLTENGCRFVMALPAGLKYCKELITHYGKEIVNSSKYMLGKGLPYGKAFETCELGFRMKVHLYYSPEKALQESEGLYELLERQENELSVMEEPPDRKLHYDKYFHINRSKDGRLCFVRNHKAIDEALWRCGFFLIAETDFQKDSKEILELYRRRDVVEKSFDGLKNPLDFKRVRTHSSESLSGKLFVSFISLIVRSYILNHVSDIPFKKILLELDKIKSFDWGFNLKSKFLCPVSKSARDMVELLRITIPFCMG